jgi:hypothetical protein
MDPYLEQFWRDVHARLVIYAADQLQRRLPGELRARVEERVVVESADEAERSVFPDVRVIERGRGMAAVATLDSGVAVAEPIMVHVPPEPMTETFIEIMDVGTGKQVVTVVEVLSVSNKLPGDGQNQYLAKKRELRDGNVSLVEIDLLRTGHHVLSVPEAWIAPSKRTPYKVCVRRGTKPWDFEMYPFPLRDRLPAIRIPLRTTDADVPLDLQELIDQCYRNGGYDEDIDYRANPVPPLDPVDAAWADELLRSKGLR